MDKLFLVTAILLQILRIGLTCLKWILKLPYILICYCLWSIKRGQRIAFVKIYLYKKKHHPDTISHKQTGEVKQVKTAPQETISPVGRSKTVFITQLPKLKSIEPFQSIPLEKEYVVEYTQDPEIDPDEVAVQEPLEKVYEMLLDEEPEMFAGTGDLPSDLSSGVTIEQLTRTYSTLTQENTNADMENHASDILEALQGSEFFNFFMLHAQCSVKAKQLMDQRREYNTGETSFDEHKYI